MYVMGKLGYIQECQLLRVSKDMQTDSHGKMVACAYVELDVSARNRMTGGALNKRYLVARVLNSKLIAKFRKMEFPCWVVLRLYASGYRDREKANRCACAIDVYEILDYCKLEF